MIEHRVWLHFILASFFLLLYYTQAATTCFGLSSDSPNVCNGRGTCAFPDTCVCNNTFNKNLPEGLIMHFNFEGTDHSKMYDVAGVYNFTAQAFQTTPYLYTIAHSAGVSGNARVFRKSDKTRFVVTKGNPEPVYIGNFTLSSWFYLSSSNRFLRNYVIDLTGSSTNRVSIFLETNTDVKIGYFIQVGSSEHYEILTPVLNTTSFFDKWHHAAFVRDYDQIYGYLDGVQLGNLTISSTEVTLFNNVKNTTIGAYSGCTSCNDYFFTGMIDEILLFRRPLDIAQLNNLVSSMMDKNSPNGIACENYGCFGKHYLSESVCTPSETCAAPNTCVPKTSVVATGALGSVERPAKTCLGVYDGGARASGQYYIQPASSTAPFLAFCDFSSANGGGVWTLIEAFTRGASSSFNYAFFQDQPIGDDKPNLERYRASYTQMSNISATATEWRALCGYPSPMYQDFSIGRLSQFDILRLDQSQSCAVTKLTNIRGVNCSECSVWWNQGVNTHIHMNSSYLASACAYPQLDARNGSIPDENDFGNYQIINPYFGCTAESNSSTTWWMRSICDPDTTCNGNGACNYATGQCNCRFGFKGNRCETPIYCFGVNANSSSVCSGFGTCIDTDVCVCNNNETIVTSMKYIYEIQTGFYMDFTAPGQVLRLQSLAQAARYQFVFKIVRGLRNCAGVSLEAVAAPNNYVSCPILGGDCTLSPRDNPTTFDSTATFILKQALSTDFPTYYSLQALPPNTNYHVRHTSLVFYLHVDDSTQLYKDDATFAILPPLTTQCFGIVIGDPTVCSANGTCVANDTCSCSTNYFGSQCEKWNCSGIPKDDPRACNNGNGTCVNHNSCICADGYSGSQCQTPICYGKLATDPSVCSGTGACIRYNACQCNQGYLGSQCETYTCFGIPANSSAVCSGNGECIGYNNCLCDAAATGDACERSNGTCSSAYFDGTSYMQSLRSSDFLVGGFDNFTIEVWIKYTQIGATQHVATRLNAGVGGRYAIRIHAGNTATAQRNASPYVVTSPGNAIKPNTWTHLALRYQYPTLSLIVNGVLTVWDDTHTTSLASSATTIPFMLGAALNQNYVNISLNASIGEVRFWKIGVPTETIRDNMHAVLNGSEPGLHALFNFRELRTSNLIAIDRTFQGRNLTNFNAKFISDCRCKPNYTGSTCSLPICFGFASNSSQVCNYNNGTCIDPNTCVCNDGYIGLECEIPICFGFFGNTTNACSNHGTCIKKDVCSCSAGYGGPQCQYPICFGKLSTDPSVCSMNGTCNSPETCGCNDGYSGSQCETPICYGKQATDLGVCSSNGTCVKKNTCQCSPGFVGSQCEEPTCFGIPATNATVCNGNGNCVNKDICLCDIAASGSACEISNGTCSAAFFNGTAYLKAINIYDFAINGTQNFTIEMWVKYPNPSTLKVLASRFNINRNGRYKLFINEVGRLVATRNAFPWDVPTAVNVVTENTWNHIAFKYEFPTLSLLVNGVALLEDSNNMNPMPDTTLANIPFLVGAELNQDNLDVSFEGLMSEFRFWTFPVPTSSIRANMNKTLTGSEPGLYAYFNFRELRTANGIDVLDRTLQGRNLNNFNVAYAAECRCKPNYTGPACGIPICYGIPGNLSSVCNGHGSCVDVNSCVCNEGYNGVQCETPICFGKAATDPAVCSRNGTCVAKDTCSCINGFVGPQCDVATCFGINSTTPGVCRGNGTCVNQNVCQCNLGYTGAECQYPVCYGKASNDPSACSGHGSCFQPNTCQCHQGYTDLDCHVPICFGLNATNPLVCSGNGTCVSTNNCSCLTGFTSDGQCLMPVCFGKNASEAAVCSSRGYCNGPNQCICQVGYLGAQCENYNCFGVDHLNPSVCNANGTCIGPDICSCNTGFVGNNCQIPVCYGLNATDQSVCNNRNGSCIGHDICTCQQGYTGSQCETPICFGLTAADSSVCGGNGTCIRKDTCVCAENYVGNACQFPVCFSYNSTDPAVCSRNGTCTRANTCLCYEGYAGQMCEIAVCFGFNSTDSRVCSSNGTCTKRDHCNCYEGYVGDQCQVPVCYGIANTSDTVCSNRNGTCISKDNCLCNEGYTGTNCQTPICFGIPASELVSCGNGTCQKHDSCHCDAGYYGNECQSYDCFGNIFSSPLACSANGSCLAPNNCRCDDGYVGSQCQIPVCFGVMANETTVCSGRNGTCVSKNKCICDAGYVGERCHIPVCYGKNASDSTVCSNSNGTCVGRDICACQQGYTGNQCEIPICFDVLATSDHVCSRNGTCIKKDTCACNPTHVGIQCEIPVCYGTPANMANVCSGNGTCTAADSCICNGGHAGKRCEHSICFGLLSNESTVCSGHGSCVSPNSCICDNDYTGIQCNIPMCYGLNATNPLVCSGNGTCISANNCSCYGGLTDGNCALSICFGKNSTDPAVCNSHGYCNSPDECLCHSGYYGNQCDKFDCYGMTSNASTVCSSNGTCTSPNSCNCSSGYTGDQCQISICHGILANNPSACSNNGTCVAKDTCLCDTGYVGDRCQFPTCFGKHQLDVAACSSNGTCVKYNVCHCNQGYTDDQCQTPLCYGIKATESSVCSGRNGTCIKPDNCVCNENYIGDSCEIPVCFGFPANTTSTCHGNGTCIKANTCECRPGYSGVQCELNVCFGKLSNDPSVCSGHGICVSPNTCTCGAGYVDLDCHMPLCFGLNASNPAVCGGNGTCTSPNNCSCLTGFSDGQCKLADCFGKNSSDLSVCSGHGYCNGPNSCICNAGYFGNNCQNFKCYGVLSNSSLVCSSNGTCIYPDTCSCNSGYGESNCQTPICFGKLATDNQVCSQNGTCVKANTCNCNVGYTGPSCEIPICFGIEATNAAVCSNQNGTCIAKDKCQCINGYTGPSCNTPICNGKLASDGTACSSQGSCTKKDTCVCKPGYAGNDCQFVTCQGVSSNDARVCSGNGDCINVETCRCKAGFGGTNCQFYTCSSILSTNSSVCGGRGNCTNSDECKCSTGWTGTNCETPVCFGLNSTSPAVCNWRNGTCISSDTCSCSSNYTGQDCSVPVCFGKSTNETCSGKGACVAVNKCSCKNGTFGQECESFTCFGLVSNDLKACHGKGSCRDVDTCICSAGYFGDQCEKYSCFGIMSFNASVCSSNGNCVAPNACNCTAGYSGSNCEQSICFGTSSNDSLVCSGRGRCIKPNLCDCNAGYSGPKCEIADGSYSCFGKSPADLQVCSGQGTCTAMDSCNCTEGTTGPQCQHYLCHGKASNAASVCYGNGICNFTNSCVCNKGYFGSECKSAICFGVEATSSSVCNSRGICVSPDNCVCQAGYTGKCDLAVCFGKNQTDPTVCNGRGTCTSPNQCQCKKGSLGSQCEISTCFGLSSTDIQVCGGRGVCSNVDSCNCQPGYTGSQCEVPICFGKLSNDTTACGGRGTCIRADTCLCPKSDATGYWSGAECQTCERNYQNDDCKTPICDAALTCGSRGVCNNLKCVCNQNEAGYYNGTFCEKCLDGYYGDNCNVRCVKGDTCNNQGVCSAAGTCICHDDDIKGHFEGTSCNQCKSGWTEKTCKTFVPGYFNFSNSGDRLIGELLLDGSDFLTSINCSALLSITTLAKLGSKPTCAWRKRVGMSLTNSVMDDYRYFEIVFGASPSLMPTDSIVLNDRAFSILIGEINLRTISLRAPAAPLSPTASIQGPTTVSPCEGVTLDASFSTSNDRRELLYTWTCTNGPEMSNINNFLQTQNKTSVSIPTDLLQPGSTYDFQVIVYNFLGISSEPARLTVTKSEAAVATAEIRGPKVQRTVSSKFFKLEGNARIPDCFYINKELIYSWRQVSGILLNIATNERNLNFPAYAFPAAESLQEYEFELTVTPVANVQVGTTATVRVVVEPQELVAVIRGGNRALSRNSSLVLDASASNDPDNTPGNATYSWTCTNPITKGFCPFFFEYVLPNEMVITMPRYVLPAGVFQFSLVYSKGSRYSTSSISITVLAANAPQISITTTVLPKINREDKLVIRASASVEDPTAVLRYQWSAKNYRGPIELTSAMLLAPTNQPNLAVRPGSLAVGEQYQFVVTAEIINSRRASMDSALAFSETQTTIVNEAPLPGVFEVTPSEGTTMETLFTLQCSQWFDEDLPLQYSFAYFDQSGNPVILSSLSLSNKISLQLPIGDANKNYSLTLQARVADKLGASTSIQATVIVKPVTVANSSQLVEIAQKQSDAKLSTALATGNTEGVAQIASAIAQFINIPSTKPKDPPPTPEDPKVACPNDCSGNGKCQKKVTGQLTIGVCECVVGYTTSDCSLTLKELRERQQLRQQLLNAVIKSSNDSQSQEPLSKEAVSSQAAVISQITTNPDELTPTSKLQAVQFIATLVAATSQNDDLAISQETAKSIGSVLSNIATSSFAPSSTSSSKDIADQIKSTASQLLSSVLKATIPGEEPQAIILPAIQLLGMREYPTGLNNLNIRVQQYDNTQPASQFKLPSSILSNLLKSKNKVVRSVQADTDVDVSSLSSVNVQAINYEGNPYSFSPESQNISSSVVSFSLKNDKNQEIKVENLDEAIIIVIPGTFDPSSLTTGGCINTESSVPTCRYWSVVYNTWRTEGCKLLNVSATAATCACNHLTDFAAFVQYITPEMNVLTPEDFKNLANLNYDNSGTLVILICLIVIYFLAVIAAYLVDLKYAFKTEQEFYKKKELVEMGKFSSFIEAFKVSHFWLSIIFRPNTRLTFTRPQRVTVVFLGLLAGFCVNALFYNVEQANVARVITAAIISSLIPLPISLFFPLLFSFINPLKNKPAITNAPTATTLVNSDFELEELGTSNEKIERSITALDEVKKEHGIKDPVTPPPSQSPTPTPATKAKPSIISKLAKKQQNENETSMVALGSSDFETEDLAVSSVHVETQAATMEQVQNESVLTDIKPEEQQPESITTENPEGTTANESRTPRLDRRLSQRSASFAERRKSRTVVHETAVATIHEKLERRKSIVNDLKGEAKKKEARTTIIAASLDNFADRVEAKVRTAVGSQEDITASKKWVPLFILVTIACILLYFAVFVGVCLIMEFLFKRFWSSYFTTILMSISVLGLILLFEYLYFNQKKEKFKATLEWNVSKLALAVLFLSITACLIGIVITFGVASIFSFWKTTDGIVHTVIVAAAQVALIGILVTWVVLLIKKPKINYQDVRKKSNLLPWWCIFIAYPIAYLVGAVLCVILVVYSIRLGPRKNSAWIGSSFLGVAQDIFLNRPIMVLLQFFTLRIVLSVIQLIFLEGWNITVSRKTPPAAEFNKCKL